MATFLTLLISTHCPPLPSICCYYPSVGKIDDLLCHRKAASSCTPQIYHVALTTPTAPKNISKYNKDKLSVSKKGFYIYASERTAVVVQVMGVCAGIGFVIKSSIRKGEKTPSISCPSTPSKATQTPFEVEGGNGEITTALYPSVGALLTRHLGGCATVTARPTGPPAHLERRTRCMWQKQERGFNLFMRGCIRRHRIAHIPTPKP